MYVYPYMNETELKISKELHTIHQLAQSLEIRTTHGGSRVERARGTRVAEAGFSANRRLCT